MLPVIMSIPPQLVSESAFQAGDADDRNHVRSTADLVGCFPLTCLAILDGLRQRLVEGCGLGPGSHFPHPASIVARFHKIFQWPGYLRGTGTIADLLRSALT